MGSGTCLTADVTGVVFDVPNEQPMEEIRLGMPGTQWINVLFQSIQPSNDDERASEAK